MEENERALLPPAYACDHNKECECTAEDFEGEWEWDDYLGYWSCKHCGDIQ